MNQPRKSLTTGETSRSPTKKLTKTKSINTSRKIISLQKNVEMDDNLINKALKQYDKDFLEFKTNKEVKITDPEAYEDVDFTALNDLDFQTNRANLEKVIEEIDLGEDNIMDEGNQTKKQPEEVSFI